MQLTHGLHLAYCTNIHRGETWDQTFGTLKQFTLGVHARAIDMLEMKKRGHTANLIDKVAYQNPIAFMSQSPKFKLPS